MGICKFVNELNRLRKSSSDSIDNIGAFDDFKRYMHVSRIAEEDLKSILRNVNDSGKKTLVLLCGSAGDGKSHLLSYLKNSDEENLLEGYTVYNDATESNAPSKTAIETLNELLAPFSDENIEADGTNIILAINLGVLSNFIESECGKSFSFLKQYVDDSYILTSQINDNKYDTTSHFQHVSFSDYHMYSLSETGAKGQFVEDLLEKVFCSKPENVFYTSYQKCCASCPLSQKCPVKKNYEFLMGKKRQVFIADLLVRTVAQDKAVLTTREILNFIFDIVVPQDFNVTQLQKIIDDATFLKVYLRQITPSLIFDSSDVTVLMNLVRKYDPILQRNEVADEFSVSYYVSSDISKEVRTVLLGIPYGEFLCEDNNIKKLNADRALKTQVYNLLVRIKTIESGGLLDEIYRSYLRDLYLFNAGKVKKLGSLYSMVENSVIQWCGRDLDGNLCLNDRYQGISLYENIKFNAQLDHIPHPENDVELQRFIPSITVSFQDYKDDSVIQLDIDYSLYKMMYLLNRGYIQTADDRNNHADYIGFVSRILQTGSLTDTLIVTLENGQRASISKGMFGYRFKVVK